MRQLDIYIDGAAKGNPGPAGIGVVIYQDGQVLKNVSKFIGNTTNNVAEYSALIYALQETLIGRADKIMVWTDSELLCKQLKGEYKVRNENLKTLFAQAKHLSAGFASFKIQHISRDDNQAADKLANLAVKKHRDKRQA